MAHQKMKIMYMFKRKRKPIDFALGMLWHKIDTGVWFKCRYEMFPMTQLQTLGEVVRLQLLDEME